jgi:Amt family ammonium transporter
LTAISGRTDVISVCRLIFCSQHFSGLAAALVLGKRRGYGSQSFQPHNLPMTITGAALLWFGWFGFNAGSALAVNGLAVNAFVVTHIAAACATLTWSLAEWWHGGKATTLGAASGAVAGLVAITPACGFVGPLPAIGIGGVAGLLCYWGVSLKSRFGFDDALDVVGIHGLGGIFGALATGLFASKAVNPSGADGLFFGNPSQLFIQAVSVVASIAFSFVMALIILKVVDKLVGLRVADDEEEAGPDVSMHSETGYSF